MLWKSSPKNKVFKIVWGEKGAHPQKGLCLISSEGNLCTITTQGTTPAQIKGTNRHQISGLQLSLGNHWTNPNPLAAHTRPLNIVVIIFTYIICPWQHQKLSIWSNDHHKHILSREGTCPYKILSSKSCGRNLWTLGSSSTQNIVLEIIWGEQPPTPTQIRELINTI